MRRLLLGTAVAALLAIAPAGASAATRYVASTGNNSSNDCLAAAAPCETIQHAAEAAASGDTIRIATGTYEGLSTVPNKPLEFVGAGPGTLESSAGATVVRGADSSSGSGRSAFFLDEGGAVRSLRAEGGQGAAGSGGLPGQPGGYGLLFSGPGPVPASVEIEDVIAIGGRGGNAGGGPFPGFGGTGLSAFSGTVDVTAEDSAFVAGPSPFGGTGPFAGSAAIFSGEGVDAQLRRSRAVGDPVSALGVNVANGATVKILDSSVDAGVGTFVSRGDLTLERSLVKGRNGEALQTSAVPSATATTTAIDSLLVSESTYAAALSTGSSDSLTSLEARGTTLFSRGGAAALSVTASAGAGPAVASLRNSIVRQVKEPGEATVDLRADRGVIDADSSSFTTFQAVNGGSVPVPGVASNLSGDPGLVDPLAGDFRLRGTSPLIDRGNPAMTTPSERDLAGSPRSLDGNRDCIAVPDIGGLRGHRPERRLPVGADPTVPQPLTSHPGHPFQPGAEGPVLQGDEPRLRPHRQAKARHAQEPRARHEVHLQALRAGQGQDRDPAQAPRPQGGPRRQGPLPEAEARHPQEPSLHPLRQIQDPDRPEAGRPAVRLLLRPSQGQAPPRRPLPRPDRRHRRLRPALRPAPGRLQDRPRLRRAGRPVPAAPPAPGQDGEPNVRR